MLTDSIKSLPEQCTSLDSLNETSKVDELSLTSKQSILSLENGSEINHERRNLDNSCEEDNSDLILDNKCTFDYEFEENESASEKLSQTKDSLDWVYDIFPRKGRKESFLDNEDVISREESELRIIWFMNFLAFCSLMVLIGEMITIGILVIPHVPNIVQPILRNDELLRYKTRLKTF